MSAFTDLLWRFAQVFKRKRKREPFRPRPVTGEMLELRRRYDTARAKHMNTKPIIAKLKKAQAARLKGE